MSYTIYDLYRTDLEKELIGKVITNIDEGNKTLTLDDGTVLAFKDTEDCCAWFDAELKAGNLTENVITAIKHEERDTNSEDIISWVLHILAVDKNIADLTITGDPTSGFYCRSINMSVYSPQDIAADPSIV